MKKIRVGVVGLNSTRGWASLAHIPAINNLPEFELTALSNRTKQAAEEAAQAFGVPHAYADNRSLVNSPDVDLVVVNVRVPEHKEVVELALAAGKHVYSEWPLGKNLEETEALAKVAKDKNLKTFIGLQSRNMPEFTYLRDLVKRGALGEIQSTTLVGSGIYYGAEMPQWAIYSVDANNGIGMIYSTFGNAVDALTTVLGEFTELNATATTRRKTVTVSETREKIPMTVFDQIAVNGVLKGGAVASVHYRGGTLKSNNFMWEINGSDGYVLVTGEGGNPAAFGVKVQIARSMDAPLTDAVIPEQYYRRELDGLPQPAVNVGHHYALVAKDITEGTSLAPTFEDAVRRHRVIKAIETAAQTGRRQQLPAFEGI